MTRSWMSSLRLDPSVGGNELSVTQVDVSTWTVETQAAPNDVAFCLDGARGYHVGFKMTVALKP